MNRGGVTVIAAALSVALLASATLPVPAQDPGGEPRQGRRQRGGFGGFGGGPFGRGGMMGGGMFNMDPTQSSKIMLLQRDDVRTELGISARQREQMDQERQKAMEEMRNNRPPFDFQSLQGLSPEERRAKMQELREQMMPQMRAMGEQMAARMEAVLTPAQQKRLAELDLQWRGPLALGDEKVASKVGLTPDQQRQIANILNEFRTGQMEVMRNAMGDFRPGGRGQGEPGGPPQFNPEEMRARFEATQREVQRIRKASEDKVVALLTAQQRQTWKTLQGKAFTFRTAN
ncbi:MAG: Spy/CpxP family protein refolding chaperone [Chloroherpetonaceae bacterium]|nr:Spy/CpxP family protein refolding chaperone [Chthonomonadaceae bacterium]MDW8208680.1 Spy/CpxP family protein refolding chaperone [Chloroherpetonaceae bacterium]